MRRYTQKRIDTIIKGGTKGQRKNLSYADLSYADLFNADLFNANLRNANLSNADLRNANLSNADLYNANLSYANLRNADLSNADLRFANLYNADLLEANLRNAVLRYVENIPEYVYSVTNILPEGTIYGYKKLNKDVIIRIRIPAKAKRSNATGRKCRCEYAYFDKVIDNPHKVKHFESGYNNMRYFKGKKIVPDSFDTDRWDECSNGIHFFITEREARDYGL